jgi:hypothetical protein
MLNYMIIKKRDQKKQSMQLRAPTETEMDGMHNNFKIIVKKIGGLVNPAHYKLQNYLQSSIV